MEEPLPPTMTVYCSPATLVVCPTNMVSHWADQLKRNASPRLKMYQPCTEGRVQDRKLRLLSKDDPTFRLQLLDPISFAWDYDVIVVDFNTMSTGKCRAGVSGAGGCSRSDDPMP